MRGILIEKGDGVFPESRIFIPMSKLEARHGDTQRNILEVFLC